MDKTKTIKMVITAVTGGVIFAGGFVCGARKASNKGVDGDLVVQGNDMYLAINSVENIKKKYVVKLKVKHASQDTHIV